MPTTTVSIIHKAADCSIRTFMACKFDSNFSGLIIDGEPSENDLQLAWDNIHIEFCDASGMEIPELSTMKSVMALQCRNKAVECFFIAVKYSYELLGEPPVKALEGLKQHGINLRWPSPDFAKQLKRAISLDKTNDELLEKLLKELEVEREIERKKRPTAQNDVNLFYSLLNNLEAEGFRISESETSALRLAIMIKDHMAKVERQRRSN